MEPADSTITIAGTVECEGNAHIKGDLSARSLQATKGQIIVDGSAKIDDKIVIEEGGLEVARNLSARNVNIDQKLVVGKDLQADSVEVGGQVRVSGRTSSRLINVGGTLECRGRVEVGELMAGNSVILSNDSRLDRLDVGGSVKLAGGNVTGGIEVDGALESTGPLTFSSLNVGGSVLLSGQNKGQNLHIGVRGNIEGDLEFRTLWVSGRLKVKGSLRGGAADIGGKLEVGNAIALEGALKVGTGILTAGSLRSRSLEVAGALEAGLAIVEETAKVGGMINTREGLKASHIETASNWEVRGPLVGTQVMLGSHSDVEDVYANVLQMADGAKAQNLYSSRLEIGDNCTVAKAIEYTDYSKIGNGLNAQPGMPRRKKELPRFPLS